MRKLIRTQLVILSSLLTAFALTLAACGGGGSSAGAGGGGGTTVVGSVNGGVAAIDPGTLTPARMRGPLVAIGNLLVPGAEAAVYSVKLQCDGGFVSEQSTDASGKFVFSGAGLSGNCTVWVGGVMAGQFVVVEGAENEVEISGFGGDFTIVKTESEGGSTTLVEVEVEDETSSDQASSDSISSDQDSSESETDSSDETSTDPS